MDSQKFIYEVPLVPLETFKAEIIDDNDCTILEEELNSIKDDTIQENNITSTDELDTAPTYQINSDLVENTKEHTQDDENTRKDATNTSTNTLLDCTDILASTNSIKEYSIIEDGTNILKDNLNTLVGTTSRDSELRDVEIFKPNSPIVLDDSPDDCFISKARHDINAYDQLYRENKLILEVIEKCLNMENSEGMLRIFNKTLIPIYLDADKRFRMSEDFITFLLQQLTKLDDMPDRKFSHVKEICELLKLHKKGQKKKVPFVTLETNLNAQTTRKRRKYKELNAAKRKKVQQTSVQTISCDSDTDVEIINDTQPTPVQIDLDSDDPVETHSDDDNHLNDSNSHSNNVNDGVLVSSDDENHNSNTGNDGMDLYSVAKELLNSVQCNSSVVDDDVVAIVDDNSNKENDVNNGDIPKEPKSTDSSLPNTNISNTENVSNQSDKVKERIKYYEKEIEIYKKFVDKLEKREVTQDNFSSPYLMCEDYKKRIVELYKQLCQLTGTEAVKRHEVTLKVTPGHPEGPVRVLEEFVNDNIDEHGNPPFPDMRDVVDCVAKANTLYNMSWTEGQVLNEARALFIHYGRAMQKRRKQREWRHLLKYVKEESLDPADTDPLLEAKLAENDRISRQREQELLDRYAELEKSNPHFDMDVSDEDSDSPSVSNDRSEVRPRETIALNTYENSCSGNLNNNVSMFVSSPEKSREVNKNTTNALNSLVNIELPIPNNGNQQNVIILCNAPGIPQNFVSVIQNLPVLNISGSLATNIVQAVPNVVNLAQKDNIGIPNDTLIVNLDKNDPCLVNPHKDAFTVNHGQNDNLVNQSKDEFFVNHAQKTTDHINHLENNPIVANPPKDVLVNQPKEALLVDQPDKNALDDNQTTVDMGSFAPIVSHKLIHYEEEEISYKTNIVFENCSKESPEQEFESLNDEEQELISSSDKEDSVSDKDQISTLNDKESTSLPIKKDLDSCDKELDNNSEPGNITVKRETEGIPNLLEELGDVTATIFAFEDPFMIVEISDSSDSEDDDDLFLHDT